MKPEELVETVEPRDDIYYRTLLEKLAIDLNLKGPPGSGRTGGCPNCGLSGFTITLSGFACARENEGGCGWAGSLEDLEVWVQESGVQGLPRAIPVRDASDDELPEFIVDDWLIEGEIHVWAGGGGSGKSSAGHETAGAVAAGFAVFDRFATREAGPVLIVSEEDSAGLIRNHLEALCHGHEWPVDDVLAQVHVLCFAQVRIEEAHWQQHLIEETQRLGAKVVFLDPLFELTSGDENSNTEAKAYVRFLRGLAAETGAAVVVVHHVSKPSDGRVKRDRIRGASALYDAARVVVWFAEDVRGIAVEPLKFSRGETPKRFVVGRTVDTAPENRLVWRSARLTYLTSEVAKERGAERLVREALARTPGLTSTELKELAKGTPGVTAIEMTRAIKSLHNLGVITFDPGSRGAKYWRLCEPAEDPRQGRQPTLFEPAEQGRQGRQGGQAGQTTLPGKVRQGGQGGQPTLPEPAPPKGGLAGSEEQAGSAGSLDGDPTTVLEEMDS